MTARTRWYRPLALLVLGAALLIAMLIVVFGLPMVEGEEAVDVSFFAFLFAGLWLYWVLGAVVVLRADGHTILAPFTNNNTLAVAASTLLAAALFQPLRARVQRTVDQRFNRARVDAQRAIDVFGAQLRDDVDLAAVQGRLIAAATVVQPHGAAVWIRGQAR